MKPLFFDTRDLDKLSRERYGLSEELMMENAAAELEKVCFFKTVIILCGSGNNGADGYTLARRLSGKEDLKLTCVEVCKAKSELCKIQKNRFELLGAKVTDFEDFSFQTGEDCCIVDCVFGSGFHGDFREEVSSFFKKINSLKSEKFQIAKIACDVPSGLRNDGTYCENAFEATETVSMGALKTCLYSDAAKDLCGKISVGNLGIQREKFEDSWKGLNNEIAPQMFLLEKSDYKPPLREKKSCNKGTFGHVTVFSGEKSGASVIAGLSALKFGAGLVTLCGKNDVSAFPELMSCTEEKNIPSKTNAIVAGPGFGRENSKWKEVFSYLESNENVAAVLDADVFYRDELPSFLVQCRNKIVLTPHPKEFQNLYKICFGEEIPVAKIIENRIELVKKFAEKYKTVTLVLKGANPVISGKNVEKNEAELFTTDLGCPSLAKAGSGDVLSGLIAALLAQNYSPLEAAKNGVLSHALGSEKFEENWSLTPLSLIEKIE